MKKEFFRYVIPAMLSFMLSGIYSIVDGIFIGRALGDNGLSAINIVWPLITLITSLGTGIGMGAAVVIGLRTGEGRQDEAKGAEGNGLMLLVAGGILLTAVLYAAGGNLISLLGGKGQAAILGEEYLRTILIGCLIQVCATGMIPLLRIHGAAFYAMVSMTTGCIVNIVLDWLFIDYLNGGMRGAALATVAGQAVTLAFGIVYYALPAHRVRKRNLRPALSMVKNIVRIGISPFGLTYLPAVTIICMNLQTLHYGGETAVSAYAVLAYILSFMELLIQGVGDGSQPLISKSKGAGRLKDLRQYRKWLFIMVIVVGLLGGGALYSLRDLIPVLYGTSVQAGAMIREIAYLFSVVMVLYGITKAAISCLYATDETGPSSLLVYGEGVLTVALVIILPRIWGLDGVWYTMPAVQIILTVISVVLLKRQRIQ